MMHILAAALLSSFALTANAFAQPPCDRANGTCLVTTASLDTAATSAPKVTRSGQFVANFRKATSADAPTLILLHGSGGNETSLMELAAQAAPGAALLGIRGRVVQDGISRWYKRLTPTTFDQDDIRAEADAFADFMAEAQNEYGIDPAKAIYLGYSNGANLLAAMSFLHPELVQRAALLRPMMVLKALPKVDLAKDTILMVPGKADATYGPFAPDLADALRTHGADVLGQTVELGHLLGDADVTVVKNWLLSLGASKAQPTLSASVDKALGAPQE
jgi:phospholipase/carboxylesterase